MNEVIVIETRLPDACLNPNVMVHRMVEYRAAKAQRQRVADCIRVLYPQFVDAGWEAAEISYAFYHAVRRGRDDDNFKRMMKSARDAFGPQRVSRKGNVIPGTGVVIDDTVIKDNQSVEFNIDQDERVVITLRRTETPND